MLGSSNKEKLCTLIPLAANTGHRGPCMAVNPGSQNGVPTKKLGVFGHRSIRRVIGISMHNALNTIALPRRRPSTMNKTPWVCGGERDYTQLVATHSEGRAIHYALERNTQLYP
jgi:hypothetical protein